MNQKKKDKIPAQQLLVPNYILYAGKFLTAVSPFLASRFAARMFLTPFRYKLPAREKEMDSNSTQEIMSVPAINRDIVVYHYGEGKKTILLVHGWSGRGTQLGIMAKQLKEAGYGILSFDAPGHGKAPGKISMLPFFVEAIHALDKKYGPFEAIIGHSLGGMATLRSVKEGLKTNKLIIIGTSNSVTHVTKEFARNMNLNEKIAEKMKKYLDQKFRKDMEIYSGAVSAEKVDIPTLVIHDEEDVDAPVASALEIKDSLKNGQLLITKNLGHRRILGDKMVINSILKFLRE